MKRNKKIIQWRLEGTHFIYWRNTNQTDPTTICMTLFFHAIVGRPALRKNGFLQLQDMKNKKNKKQFKELSRRHEQRHICTRKSSQWKEAEKEGFDKGRHLYRPLMTWFTNVHNVFEWPCPQSTCRGKEAKEALGPNSPHRKQSDLFSSGSILAEPMKLTQLIDWREQPTSFPR